MFSQDFVICAEYNENVYFTKLFVPQHTFLFIIHFKMFMQLKECFLNVFLDVMNTKKM